MKGYIYSDQSSLFGLGDVCGFGSDDYHVKEIGRDLANDVIVKNHYSKKFYAATYIHLGVFMGGDMVGVLQYGYAMNPASAGSVVKDTKQNEYLELNRMWLDDIAPRNSESMAISYSIKYIKERYPKIQWVQSFADERCGALGVVYQASNFGFFGEHVATFWEYDGIVYHNSLMTRDPKLSKSAAFIQLHKSEAVSSEYRQFRYLFFIKKGATKRCLHARKPYPKRIAEEAS